MIQGDGIRRLALFFGMLLSGGILFLPRIPMLVILLVLCIAARGPTLGFRIQMLPILMVLAMVLMAALAAGGIDVQSLTTRYANFLGGAALVGLYSGLPRSTLAKDLDFVLKWMVPQAILTVLLGEAFPQLFTLIRVDETEYRSFLLIFNFHVTVQTGALFLRPDGLFFEPGVYQIYLNLFLFLCLFVFKRYLWAAAALLAILTLQSTTGLLIAVALLGVAFLVYLSRFNVNTTLLAAIFGMAALVPVGLFAYDNFMTKTTGELSGSAWARQYDFITGGRVALANPVVGIGFSHERYREEASLVAYRETQLDAAAAYQRANSNGLVTVLYSMGIPLGLLFLASVFFQPFLPMRWLVAGIFLISMLTEALMLTPFFLIFVFGGIMVMFGSLAAKSQSARSLRPLGSL